MKFCERPFKHMYIYPNGDVKICAWAGGVVGNLIEQSLDEIWHSEKAERVRDAIRNGSFSYCRMSDCHYCQNGLLKDLPEEEVRNAVANEYPVDFNVACDYTCNHSCPSCRSEVFCGDAEYKKNVELMVDKLLPYLNKATVAISTDGSGDAFFSPSIMRMLENINPPESCRIGIETNGALCNEKNWEKIKHLSNHFMGITVTPNSFVPSAFKYLNGGHDSYDNVIKNLYFISDLRKKGLIKEFNISIVVQERNFMELPEFCERCINDFGADSVIVKPLYRWFKLSEDEHWHKDVSNPLHPYHKEYLEILKSPILKHPKVYFWRQDKKEATKHPAYKYQEQLELVTKCMEIPDLTDRVKKYFEARGIDNVYLYGDDTLSSFAHNITKDAVTINSFLAKIIDRDSICGVPVKRIWDYKPDAKDTIIIVNYRYFTQVKRDLDVIGFTGNVIALDKMVQEIIG